MKVLFLSVPTGQGHHQTAKAVLEYFKNDDSVECEFLDVVDNTSPFLAEHLQKGYLFSTTMAPWVYGTFYDMADKRDASKASYLGKLVKSLLNKKLYEYIKSYDPDIIVATHLISAMAFTYLKKKREIRAKSVAIVTDFTFHPFWEDTKMDYYITASELLEFQAIKKGQPAERIKPFGIPIQPHFASKTPKEEVRKNLGLANKFTILVMMGSMGYGNSTMDTVRTLNRMKEDFQLITVCGNNKKLKSRIDRMTKYKTVLNFGYTNQVADLMDAADCIITKPGGLSTSEALAKELPIIMLDPIPGQEDRNKEFMLNNGIAISISDTFPVTEAVYQLMHHDFKLEMLKQNMKHFAKPNAAREVGEFMLSLFHEMTK